MIDARSLPDANGLSVDSLRGSEQFIRPDLIGKAELNEKTPYQQHVTRDPLSLHERSTLVYAGRGGEVPDEPSELAPSDSRGVLAPIPQPVANSADRALEHPVSDQVVPSRTVNPADPTTPAGAPPTPQTHTVVSQNLAPETTNVVQQDVAGVAPFGAPENAEGAAPDA
jgi:predicted component of type VI protein secretion system